MKDESDTQLRTFFEGEDLSNLCNNQRRNRTRQYSSVEDLLKNEFAGPSQTALQITSNHLPEWSEPAVFSPKSQNFQGVENEIIDKEYRMILKEINEGQKEAKFRNKPVTFQKSRVNRRVKKSISQYEFSRRLLQQSVSSQLKSLSIEQEARCIFSIGKHLYSNNFNGKIKIALESPTQGEGSLPIVRPIKKLQEWTKCQKAEEMVSQAYHLMAQTSCSENKCSESSSVDSSVNYLTFFEEGYLINLVVSQRNLVSWLREYQVYSLFQACEQVATGLSSCLADIKSSVGCEVRICDLVGFLKNKVKVFTSNSHAGQSKQTIGCSLRSP